jgi:hypothetical protein
MSLKTPALSCHFMADLKKLSSRKEYQRTFVTQVIKMQPGGIYVRIHTTSEGPGLRI